MTTKDIIYRLGISSTYMGHRLMLTGVTLALERPTILYEVTKELYPEIAKRHQTTASRVERNLRTAVSVCWNRGNREYLDEIAGYHLIAPPTPPELIDIIAAYIERCDTAATV